jgi:hypothetical protein
LGIRRFLLKDMGVVLLHLAHYAPDVLATSPDIQHLLTAVVIFIHPPHGTSVGVFSSVFYMTFSLLQN